MKLRRDLDCFASRFCARAADGGQARRNSTPSVAHFFFSRGHQARPYGGFAFAADMFAPFGVRAGGGRNVVIRDDAGLNLRPVSLAQVGQIYNGTPLNRVTGK